MRRIRRWQATREDSEPQEPGSRALLRSLAARFLLRHQLLEANLFRRSLLLGSTPLARLKRAPRRFDLLVQRLLVTLVYEFHLSSILSASHLVTVPVSRIVVPNSISSLGAHR